MSHYSCQEHGDTAELGCVACELATDFKELQAKVEKMFTKKEIRAVLTEAYWYAADPSAQVDKLIQAMVKNKAALK